MVSAFKVSDNNSFLAKQKNGAKNAKRKRVGLIFILERRVTLPFTITDLREI